MPNLRDYPEFEDVDQRAIDERAMHLMAEADIHEAAQHLQEHQAFLKWTERLLRTRTGVERVRVVNDMQTALEYFYQCKAEDGE